MTDPQDAPITFRTRLEALLDEQDTRRGTDDARLAAYVRGCLSARDALELRVRREVRGQRRARDPQPWDRAVTAKDAQPPTPITPLYDGDPRPDVTATLTRYALARHNGGPSLATPEQMRAAAVRHCGGGA